MKEKESIEIFKWEKQNAIIVKHNTDKPYYELFEKSVTPYEQITDSGCSSSDFSIYSDKDKYDFEIRCPLICKDYNIIVSKYEIKKINIKDVKPLFNILSYIEDFNGKAKRHILNAIKSYLEV